MKSFVISIVTVTALALSLASTAAADWKDGVFTDLGRTAPRSAFVDSGVVAKTIFDQINDSAPLKDPDRINDGFAGE